MDSPMTKRTQEIEERLRVSLKAAYRHGYGAGGSDEAAERWNPEGRAENYLDHLPKQAEDLLGRVNGLEKAQREMLKDYEIAAQEWTESDVYPTAERLIAQSRAALKGGEE